MLLFTCPCMTDVDRTHILNVGTHSCKNDKPQLGSEEWNEHQDEEIDGL